MNWPQVAADVSRLTRLPRHIGADSRPLLRVLGLRCDWVRKFRLAARLARRITGRIQIPNHDEDIDLLSQPSCLSAPFRPHRRRPRRQPQFSFRGHATRLRRGVELMHPRRRHRRGRPGAQPHALEFR